MGWVLIQLSASVGGNGFFAVNVHLLVRVDGDNHLPDVGVDSALLEPVEATGEVTTISRDKIKIQNKI